ncbi:hypothetical protein PsYK624_052920 [Phanerochaete sordida]|uniref:Uncharacterized protein n=1 Tax=Phanerochaete sordida TaxID=48140 RepID=A0A9P3G4U9_9APHY|nr:hypothetical protein PsYK624_052920 [Phanerochaete sordida]
MRSTQIFALVAAALAAPVFASPAKRQGPPAGLPITTLESPGSITAPAEGTAVVAGQSFPFSVAVPEWNHCHPGYTPVNTYLLDHEPTTADLNSTYGFSNYLAFFGSYLVNNFPGGLPNMGTPPPSTLVAPDLSGTPSGTTVWLATIETIEGCPPDGFWEYAIDSRAITYNSN